MLQKMFFFLINCHKIVGMLVKTKILNNFEDHVSQDSTNAQNHNFVGNISSLGSHKKRRFAFKLVSGIR